MILMFRTESRGIDMPEIWKKFRVPLIAGGLICLWGGIYDFAVMLYGIVFSVILFVRISQAKRLFVPTGVTSKGLAVIFCSFVIASIMANDKGIAIIGSVRILVFILFWLVWNNLETLEKNKIWNAIPDAAIILTLIAIILQYIPGGDGYFFRAGRLGGVFQYSNTYAVFLLSAFIILCFSEGKAWKRNTKMGILTGGILFCGSRSVFVLFVFIVIILALKKHIEKRTVFLIIAFGAVFYLTALFFIDLDIERLLKLTLKSSTLNGRFLYWKDAVRMIIKNPLGLGYMGYYFLQPQFQTGNYVTKFVHNDILQTALDAGVFAAIALCIMIFVNIRKSEERNRIVLSVIFLQCLFDFDLQFSIMFCMMLMCMDDGKGIICQCPASFLKKVCCITGAVYVYFAAAFGVFYYGKYKIALALYPANTFAREALMLGGEAEEAADVIIERNGMLADAYEIAAKRHIEKSEYLEGQKDIQKMVTCAGYDIYYYNQAVYYLSMALDQAVRNGDSSSAEGIIKQIQDIPAELEKLKRRTSKLAYQINDKPVFELDDAIEGYIKQLSKISLNIDE